MKTIVSALLLLATIAACSKKNDSSIQNPQYYIKVEDVVQQRDSLNSTARFFITLSPQASKEIKVDYATEGGTAKADSDFVATSGTITFAPNQTQATVDVTVIGRQLRKSDQQFYLKLSNAVGAQIQTARATATLQNAGKYTLVWSDEFNGTGLNTNDWNYEKGANGWGNNELEDYKSGTENTYVQNGNLVIEAKKQDFTNNYTSARINTKGKRSFTYGKVEIRAKVPATKGLWPALWMLGQNIDEVGWPACGEIDIMEQVNKETPGKVYGTAHWGVNASSHLESGGNYSLPSGYFSDDFHVFSVEWDEKGITWFVDGNQYHTLSSQQVTGGNRPFDKDFFLIFNVAVGGNWPGNPDATSVFPQKMLVDYVRVYQK
jgi:beta-glucanase (GH16 family)